MAENAMSSELPVPQPGQMIGRCQAEDGDVPVKLLDLYMVKAAWPRDDMLRWLCEEHRPWKGDA